jgi:hypothetical protein
MEPEAIAHATDHRPNNQFGLRVLGPDVGHVLRTLSLRQRVLHACIVRTWAMKRRRSQSQAICSGR